ncbi:hypothetical protein [Phytomonospora endophytica]|uniref:Uncharacterized protein n=1 Tax=Phytomonospora endophytica TaxID=714109 RepID=A0A841FNI4_9ACTN|nr:hypothetical protein [Phytomonospora endophytica]MBB6037625.1 hypothetical protein [Phytomonospora endophytica]GIG67848.1 hypothetical protein Pen01_41430 [Phytomonospora endophytica]
MPTPEPPLTLAPNPRRHWRKPALGAALLPVIAVCAMCGWFAFTPCGHSVIGERLTTAQIAGAYQDAEGPVELTLNTDATFTATGGPAIGEDFFHPVPRGLGTWETPTSGPVDEVTLTYGPVTETGPGEVTSLTISGDAGDPVLWAHEADPDVCELAELTRV